MSHNRADPIASLLDIIDQRGKKMNPDQPVLGTVISTNPLTILLDTGQTIVNPVVVGPTST